MPLALLSSSLGRLVAVGLVVVLLSLGLYGQIRSNGQLRAERDHALAINEQNLAIIGAERAATKRANEIVAAEMVRAKEWRRHFNTMRAEIAHATPDDDGSIAPVLRRVLDRLPEPGDNKTSAVPAAGSAAKSYAVSGQP